MSVSRRDFPLASFISPFEVEEVGMFQGQTLGRHRHLDRSHTSGLKDGEDGEEKAH